MASVRNAQKAITPIVAIDPNAKAKRQRLGKVVLEVSDPSAQVDVGEQLSLSDMGTEESQSSPSSRASAGKTANKTPLSKTTPGKTTPGKTTLSKARQKSSVEASLKVPIEPMIVAQTPVAQTPVAPAQTQILEQVQQLGNAIEQLQSRLDRLHQQSAVTNPAASNPAVTNPAASNPRLPDWREPELRPHYTIKQARTAYEALEHQAHQRKLQAAAPEELQAARQVAQRLRTPHSHRQKRRSRRRFRWDGLQFVRNVYGLVQRLVLIPADPGTKLVDAAVWVLVSIGVRLVFKLCVQWLPVLGWPVGVLLAIPAMIAAYLAFCVEDSRSDVIYRLLLITVGLFLGSRL